MIKASDPYRTSIQTGSKKTKTAIPESIPKSVLDEPDFDDDNYSLTDSMIILKGECDLYCNANENDIRSELLKLFIRESFHS